MIVLPIDGIYLLLFCRAIKNVGPCQSDRRYRRIDCSSRNLTAIPEQVLAKSGLTKLDLSDNNLEDLNGVKSLNRMKDLNLAGNVFDHIGSDVFPCGTRLAKITGLEVLDFHESGPFSCLEGLKDLDLTLHSDTINETLFEGSNLEVLSLTLPNAKHLPQKLFGNIAQQIKSIRLSAPNLESLEHRFSPLMQLRKLYLDLPKVKVLPKDLLCGDGIEIAHQLNMSSGALNPLER